MINAIYRGAGAVIGFYLCLLGLLRFWCGLRTEGINHLPNSAAVPDLQSFWPKPKGLW